MTQALRRIFLLAVLAMAPAAVYSQQPPPDATEAEPESEFVSGVVENIAEGRIVVNRAVLGKPAEIRTFTITSDTKVEGELKAGVRVTVRFKTSEQGEEIAVRIIVRPPQNSKNP